MSTLAVDDKRPKGPEPQHAPVQNTATEDMFEPTEKPNYVASDDESPKAIGVGRVEAFNKVLYHSGKKGKVLLWLLGASVGLTIFAYALDMGITTTIFGTLAASTFKVHSQLGTVNTASQIIRAISKPFIGKLADITSRPTTYAVILAFYAVGFAVAASAHTFTSYTIGICFTSVGKSGLDLLSDIIVADLTPLEWRGFFSACLSLPFIVTVPVNGFIAEGFYDDWRWGLGMFAILVPVLLVPAILTLYAMQRRGEKAGMVTIADSKDVRTGTSEATPKNLVYWAKLAYRGLVGLILLGFAFSLILLPITLAKSADGGWKNPSMIAMIVIGFVILVGFVFFEVFFAPKPLMTKRILKNRAFIAARLVAALLIFCLSSLNVVGARVGVQASVPHDDVASLISIITLWSTLGSSIGSAVATSIWTEQMVDQMHKEMPGVSSGVITKIYGNIKTLKKYSFSDPIRQGGVRAYAIVNGHITIASICLSCIPLLASFFMPNYYLGKQQNAVNNKGLDGEVVDVPNQHTANEAVTTQPEHATFWQKVLALYRK
ncbi:hypothetical protein COL940_008811 [Colletotrichum noveboracense]|nr:hypothetical protein COL940_008811 [Colletotrichum noveboracense]